MREFDETWQRQIGQTSFDVSPIHMVDIFVSCTEKVQVLGVPTEEGHSAVVLKSGEEFRFRAPVYGFRKITVKGTEKVPFGLRVVHSPRQNGEYNSGEKAPVIQLPDAPNLVAQLHRVARENAAFSRMPTMEPEDDPFFERYAMDDETPWEFEEEELTRKAAEAKEAKEKAAKEAKARKEAGAGSAPTAQSPSPQPTPFSVDNPPAAAQKAPEASPGSAPPPSATAAE